MSSLNTRVMKRKNFTELTFKEIVNSILNESAEEIDDFAPETEGEDTEETEDSFDVSDFEEEGAEDETSEGDKTVTLTLDEISVLRSILAKIDGDSEEETEEDEAADDEEADDDVEITEEEDTEDDEEPADIPVPEEEETIVADGRGEAGVVINNKGVTRKKGTPAVDRSRSTKNGLMGNPAAAGDADVVELNTGVTRKKGTPAVSRSGKHTGTRIAPGKATIEIGK